MATPMATAATSTDSRQCRLHSESLVEGELVPIAGKDRIQALDIIRGFALIGIFLMNVEWFTRPITELGTGVDRSQHGIDYAASWLIYTFVQGKFWTMFSLLFGMGFAVMFTRAESSERDFVTPYVRRIIGLFLFGSAHFVLIWTGDILHNYALTAIALLLIVSNSWRAWAGILGSVAVSAGLVWWFDGEFDAVIQAATLLGVVALLMHKLHTGPLRRYYQWGAALYSLPFVVGLLFWAVSAFVPQFMHQNTTAEVKQRHQEFEQQASEHQHDRAGETRIYTQGSYAESVVFRARQYRDELLEAAGLTFLALPMFLIGFWFVRSGVIGHWQENLPLFRRLAAWTLPLGLAMTLTSVLLKPSFLPTPDRDLSAMLAARLFMWAMMPTCIGYFSALICLLGTRWGSAVLSPLRFAGQMALTNYLCASVVGTWYFSGYGHGQWGQVGRAGQVLFVAVVFSLQLLFSRCWLTRFNYGPMEWLWRAITYWQWPALRRPLQWAHAK